MIAVRARAMLRKRITTITSVVGCSLVIGGLTPYFASYAIDSTGTVARQLVWVISFAFIGFSCILLALMPTDDTPVHMTCGLILAIGSLAGLACLIIAICADAVAGFRMDINGEQASAAPRFAYLLAIGLVIVGNTVFFILPTMLQGKMATRRRLRRMWAWLRGTSVALAAAGVLYLVILHATDHPTKDVLTTPMSTFVGALLAAALLGTTTVRGRATRFLGKLGMRGNTQVHAGAAVAALVGGKQAHEAVAAASSRFRVLPISELTVACLASNTDSGLNAKTRPAKLQECGAFISHSWRDSELDGGAAKHAALCEWAAKQPAGLATTCWLDKACIDQSDIAGNLLCLPVFLSGCQTLLVLAGPTYVSRLWCLLEVFTFVYMTSGDAAGRIVLKPLGDARAVAASFVNVRVKAASCFLPEERQKLLATIESGFGYLEAFDAEIKRFLDQAVGDGVIRDAEGVLNQNRRWSLRPVGRLVETAVVKVKSARRTHA